MISTDLQIALLSYILYVYDKKTIITPIQNLVKYHKLFFSLVAKCD